jgi:hypothetical protein
MSVCVYSVCAVLCVGIGLATGWSPVQRVLPTVYRIKKLKKKSGQVPTKGCRAIDEWMLLLLLPLYHYIHLFPGPEILSNMNCVTYPEDTHDTFQKPPVNVMNHAPWCQRCRSTETRPSGMCLHDIQHSRKDTQLSQPKEGNTVTTTCVRIWGKYVYITTTTKAAVSPITTNLNTWWWPYWPKHVVYLILIFNF